MTPAITILPEKKLIGLKMTMSLANNRTPELWRKFMQRRNEIVNAVNTDLISLQVYEPKYFKHFSPENEFEKWALVEVANADTIPEGFSEFILPSGLYAVFHYKGLSSDASIYQYIFSQWLPGSGYEIDNRPHFEVLGEKYRNDDPNSEENIHIPIIQK